MKRLILVAAFACSVLASAFAIGGGGAECPDRCRSNDPNPVCCTTSGGSTYYGIIN